MPLMAFTSCFFTMAMGKKWLKLPLELIQASFSVRMERLVMPCGDPLLCAAPMYRFRTPAKQPSQNLERSRAGRSAAEAETRVSKQTLGTKWKRCNIHLYRSIQHGSDLSR